MKTKKQAKIDRDYRIKELEKLRMDSFNSISIRISTTNNRTKDLTITKEVFEVIKATLKTVY